MVPVADGAPGGVNVSASIVTCWPGTEGFDDDTICTPVGNCVTTKLSAGDEVLAEFAESPP
jgi:hypothetical protein